MIYYYNESQQDAIFLNLILVRNSTGFGQIYCPSSGVFTATGICHTSYVDCLLADSQITTTNMVVSDQSHF